MNLQKSFNCSLLVLFLFLSLLLVALIHWFTQSYCEATNVTTMLRLLVLYQFWLADICTCHKPCPTRDESHDLQIALSRTLMLPFFFILPVLHTQNTFVLVSDFEAGHFACHFLFVSFFWFCYERNSIHTAVSSSHFISLLHLAHHLFFIQLETIAGFT